MRLIYRHRQDDLVFRSEPSPKPFLLEEGPWRIEMPSPDQPPMPPGLEERVVEALVRSRIQERYNAVRLILWWGGGAPTPPWARSDREAGLKAWLDTPPSPLRFYWVSDRRIRWQLKFKEKSYWVASVEGARDCPPIFRPKIWTIDLSAESWASKTREDARRFGLPNPALIHDAPTLTEVHDQFVDAVVNKKDRSGTEPPLLPEAEYRRLLVVICDLWWKLIDRIAAMEFPVLPNGWKAWKAKSDKAFSLLREFEAKLGERLRKEGLPVLTLNIGKGRDLDESYAHLLQGTKSTHDLPLDEGELGALRQLERDSAMIPLGFDKRARVKDQLRSDPGLLEELEAHFAPVREAFLDLGHKAQEELARLRNPSGSAEAIARGWECERQILAALERLDIRDSGLDPRWDAPADSVTGLTGIVARQSALESAMPAGEEAREWINKLFADPRLGDLKPAFLAGETPLPEAFWSSLGSERGTKHVDLLMAWHAGRCRELAAGEILPLGIASLAHAGWATLVAGKGAQQIDGSAGIPPSGKKGRHARGKQEFERFLATLTQDRGLNAAFRRFEVEWPWAMSQSRPELERLRYTIERNKLYSKMWNRTRRISAPKRRARRKLE